MPLETTWTRPNEWCPAPQWWHANDDEATEDEVTVLVAALVTALQPDFVVETGSHLGHTAYAIGSALNANGHGRLDTIENNETKAKLTAIRCSGLPVNVICGDTLAYDPPEPVGFAWFDSGPIRHLEIERYWDQLVDGIIVGVHDTGPQHGVWDELQPLIADGRLNALNLHTPRGVVLAQIHK